MINFIIYKITYFIILLSHLNFFKKKGISSSNAWSPHQLKQIYWKNTLKSVKLIIAFALPLWQQYKMSHHNTWILTYNFT